MATKRSSSPKKTATPKRQTPAQIAAAKKRAEEAAKKKEAAAQAAADAAAKKKADEEAADREKTALAAADAATKNATPADDKVKDNKPEPKKEAPEVVRVKAMLDKYCKNAKAKVINAQARAALVTEFASLIIYVISHPRKDVLNVVFSRFVEEPDVLMDQGAVLGSANVLRSATRVQTETFYTIFVELINAKLDKKKKLTFNLEAARRMLQSDELISFIRGKMK